MKEIEGGAGPRESIQVVAGYLHHTPDKNEELEACPRCGGAEGTLEMMLSYTAPLVSLSCPSCYKGSLEPHLQDNAQLSCKSLPGLCSEVLHQPSRMACWASRQHAKEQ